MKEELRTFALNLDTYMRFYGHNQSSLAKVMDVSPQVVSKWCRGVSSPSWVNIDKMCEVFHCTRGQLVQTLQTEESIRDTKKEQQLMGYYKKLNSLGKDKVLEFLEDLNPKFFKEEP